MSDAETELHLLLPGLPVAQAEARLSRWRLLSRRQRVTKRVKERVADAPDEIEFRGRRTVWTLHRWLGARVEVVLDAGKLVAGERNAPVLGLRLVLREGPADALYALAQAFASSLAVLPDPEGLAERAKRWGRDEAPLAWTARPVRLATRVSPLAAAAQVLAGCFDQFVRNLVSMRDTDDPEVVHQARVAWRRWRSAVRLFSPWLLRRLEADGLAPLLQALGPLRDLDVLRDDTLGRWLPHFVGSDAKRQAIAERVIQQIDEQRAALRAHVREELARPAPGQALLALAGWLHQLAEDAAAVDQSPVPKGGRARSRDDWAERRLRKLRRRLEKAVADSHRSPTDSQRSHRVRILAKRTRYAAEMLGDLLPPKRAKALVKRMSQTQTRLGEERDLRQALVLLEGLGSDATLIAFLHGVLSVTSHHSIGN